MRQAATFARNLTIPIIVLAFVLSYAALYDVALRSGLGSWQSYLWPLIVDGMTLVATRATVELKGHAGYRYAWCLLGCGIAVSIAANVIHPLLPPGPVVPGIAAVVAVIPPLAMAASIHLMIMLGRLRAPDAGAESTAPAEPAPHPAHPAPTRHLQVSAPDSPVPDSTTPAESESAEPANVRQEDVQDQAVPVPDAAPMVDAPAPEMSVSERRMEAAQLRADGRTFEDIADRLGVSERTARRDVAIATGAEEHADAAA